MDSPSWQFLSTGKTTLLRSMRRGLLVTQLCLQRAIRAGGDSRLDEIKHQTGTFTAFWMAQGLFADLFSLHILTFL